MVTAASTPSGKKRQSTADVAEQSPQRELVAEIAILRSGRKKRMRKNA
jgi:hypothetical protein